MPPNETTINIAIELSSSLWLVATRLPGAAKSRVHRINAGDTTALLTLFSDLRVRTPNRPGSGRRPCLLFRGGARRLLAAPAADRQRRADLCGRTDQYSGEPPRTPGQD